VLAHKDKEITDALEGAGVQPTESEVAPLSHRYWEKYCLCQTRMQALV
jgi:hypothetical protein